MASYSNTERRMIGYKTLRQKYQKNTIALDVGWLNIMAFDQASKYAREVVAMGYLDTLNYFQNAKIQEHESDFENILDHFEMIYRALLLGSGQDPERDAVLTTLQQMKSNSASAKDRLLGFVKSQSYVFGSLRTFALSRAVERYQNTLKLGDAPVLSDEQLLTETHQRARKQRWLTYTQFNPAQAQDLTARYKRIVSVEPDQNPPSRRSEIIAEALFKPKTGP